MPPNDALVFDSRRPFELPRFFASAGLASSHFEFCPANTAERVAEVVAL